MKHDLNMSLDPLSSPQSFASPLEFKPADDYSMTSLFDDELPFEANPFVDDSALYTVEDALAELEELKRISTSPEPELSHVVEPRTIKLKRPMNYARLMIVTLSLSLSVASSALAYHMWGPPLDDHSAQLSQQSDEGSLSGEHPKEDQGLRSLSAHEKERRRNGSMKIKIRGELRVDASGVEAGRGSHAGVSEDHSSESSKRSSLVESPHVIYELSRGQSKRELLRRGREQARRGERARRAQRTTPRRGLKRVSKRASKRASKRRLSSTTARSPQSAPAPKRPAQPTQSADRVGSAKIALASAPLQTKRPNQAQSALSARGHLARSKPPARLSRADFTKVMRSVNIARCRRYVEALTQAVRVRVVVQPSGRASSVTLLNSEIQSRPFARCLVRNISARVFKRILGGERATFTYTFP